MDIPAWAETTYLPVLLILFAVLSGVLAIRREIPYWVAFIAIGLAGANMIGLGWQQYFN